MSYYHLSHGVDLKIKLPVALELISIADRQQIYSELIKEQVSHIAGNKFGIICIGKLSTYDTKEKMIIEYNKMNTLFVTQIYFPPTNQTP